MYKYIYNLIKRTNKRRLLVFLFTILISILSAIVFFVFPAEFENQARKSIEDKANSIAEIAAINLSPALYFEDHENITDAIIRLNKIPDITDILVFDNNGKLLIKADKSSMISKEKDLINYTFYNNKKAYFTSKKIEFNNKVLGTIYIRISLDDLQKRVQETKYFITIISIFLFFLGFFATLGISSFISRPLKSLVNTFTKISDGDLSIRAKVSSQDEFGHLAYSFNSMVDKLLSARAELEKVNSELEIIVENRTKELLNEIEVRKNAELKINTLNQELECRVVERTAELEKALSELQELNDLKSRFITMISHEYRTPLTIILTSTAILEKLYLSQDKDNFTKFAKKINNSVETMTKLLDDVLIIGRDEAGKTKIVFEEILLLSFINDIIIDVQTTYNKLHYFEIINNLKQKRVVADPNLLQQILINLISNAIKYTIEGGQITIEIFNITEFFCIRIKDSGIGITKEDMEHLYESFHRGTNVGNVSGTGLGMSIIKRCVNAMNGYIEVDSEVNVGTEFRVFLPDRKK